jgi:hypothetical protein
MLKHTSCNFNNVIRDSRDNLKKIPNFYSTLVPNRLGYLSQVKLRNKQPYDLTEIYRAVDTESFISASMRKKVLLILKGGYKLVSEDEANIEYIKTRIAEIESVSDIIFEDFLLEMISSLVYNHNAYIYLNRRAKSSSGNVIKSLQPIASLHPLPETKVFTKEDHFDQVVSYEYKISPLYEKEINKQNIIHLMIDKKPGINLGTPPLESVRDDILSLRQIEESLERLIYKLTSPLIHMIVGTDTRPATIDRRTGRPETEIYNDTMMDMEDAGGITTSERVQIKMIGAESHALRLESPIKHYVNRVLMGLNTSELDLGIGNSTTAGSAEAISNSLKENIEMYQYLISNMITNKIFNLLLLESDKYKSKQYIPKEERVNFVFEKSDINLKLKIESHMLQEVNAGVITINEYRIATGRFELTDKQIKEKARDAGQDLTGGSNGLIKQNVIKPVNQHTKKKTEISDQLDTYLEYLEDGKDDMATEVLYTDIRDSIDMPEMDVKLHQIVSALTTTLQKYIIKKVPRDVVRTQINNMLDRHLTEMWD